MIEGGPAVSRGGRRVLLLALVAVGGLAGACYPNPDELRNAGGTAGTGGSCLSPGSICALDNQCCQSGTGVSDGAFCIEQTGLCHAKCAINDDCVSNCCVPVTGQPLGACMSASFCGFGGGVGDPCTSSSECASGSCDGWCQESCSVADALCESAPGSLRNAQGFYNWCFDTSSGAACFPGCSTNSDCTVYGLAYTCQSAPDVTGHTTKVCSL